jgi:hypothetical protein
MTPDELQRTFTPTASAPLSRRSLEEAFTAIKNETDDAKMRGRIDDYLDIAAELPPAERQAATRRLADYFDHSRTQ